MFDERKEGMVSELNRSTQIHTNLILAWPMAQPPFPLELLSGSFKRGDGTKKKKKNKNLLLKMELNCFTLQDKKFAFLRNRGESDF